MAKHISMKFHLSSSSLTMIVKIASIRSSGSDLGLLRYGITYIECVLVIPNQQNNIQAFAEKSWWLRKVWMMHAAYP